MRKSSTASITSSHCAMGCWRRLNCKPRERLQHRSIRVKSTSRCDSVETSSASRLSAVLELESGDDISHLMLQGFDRCDDRRSSRSQCADGNSTAGAPPISNCLGDRRGGQGSRQVAASEENVAASEKAARRIHHGEYTVRDGPRNRPWPDQRNEHAGAWE